MTEAPATETVCIDLPLQTRADVRLQPDTVDAEARTVEVVWSTGAAVRRTDLWMYRFRPDRTVVRFGRMSPSL